jgi:hypothetical protein
MGWVKVEKPAPVSDSRLALGPYRESAGPQAASLDRSWRTTATGGRWFLTFVAVFWNGCVGAAFVSMARGDSITLNGHHYSSFTEASRHDVSAYLFPIVFPLVGLVLAYIVLAMWLNRTRVTVDRFFLRIERGPVPWRGRCVEFAVGRLRQLYVEKYVSYRQNNRPVTAFRVMAQVKDGEPVLVDGGMGAYEDARSLEQWLEAKLDIKDVPVAGEAERA